MVKLSWFPKPVRCVVCGGYVGGTYVTTSFGDTFCAEHRDLPQCFSCSRPVQAGAGATYRDGRRVCQRCRMTALDESAAGRPVLDRVRAALAGVGIDLRKANVPLRLADQDELTMIASVGGSAAPSGFTRTRLWTVDGRVVRRQVDEVLVLRGLPAEHFAAVAAHELGHAWLFLKAFPDLPPTSEEGFAELVSYLWLREQRTPEAAYRLSAQAANSDPIYGDGFRLALAGFTALGLASLCAYLRTHHRIPDGASLR